MYNCICNYVFKLGNYNETKTPYIYIDRQNYCFRYIYNYMNENTLKSN